MTTKEQAKGKMAAAIEHLKEELKGIRTGRANPAMLDNVSVDVYGTHMRIKDLASVNAPEPRQLLITPYDQNNKAAISKAIERANLGYMPVIDDNVIRIPIPPMNEDLRKEMVKVCHKKREEAKVSVRNIRREANDWARKQKSDGEIAEDMMKKLEKEIQELTDKYCKEADELADKKENEVTTI